MEILSKALLTIHIIAGFSSLVLFWIPAFTRKGGKIHNLIGRWYVRGMWVVLATAVVLSIENFVEGDIQSAIFLGFLAILTANPLWFGIEILKNKKSLSPATRRMHFYQNLLLFVTGVVLLIYGVSLGGNGILMMVFGILGVGNGGMLIRLFKDTYQPRPWIVEHFAGMIVGGIASHTAFFAFGGSQFFQGIFTGYLIMIPWVAPTVIGLLAIRILEKKYQPK
ncbi:MAG: hypothetical protein AB8G22_07580 [Saprospiraceae bacterium]